MDQLIVLTLAMYQKRRQVLQENQEYVQTGHLDDFDSDSDEMNDQEDGDY